MSRLRDPKVLIAIALIGLVIFISRTFVPVPLPGIQLPAEMVPVGPFRLPNTFLATLLADATILLIVFLATRNMKDMVPSGLRNVVEWMIEGFYNLCEDVAGANARKFFPWIMTIFLLVLTANWWELVPGFDSIGVMETHGGFTHYETRDLGFAKTIVSNEGQLYIPKAEGGHGEAATEDHGEGTATDDHSEGEGAATDDHSEGEAAADDHGAAAADDHHTLPTNEAGREVAVLVPYLRAAATDLNFTMALALIAMTLVQYYGIQALGGSYFTKFFNFKGGAMGFAVGILELISEISRIISFAFRLFGNIFAGQVLLFVMAFLVPWLLPLPFYGLELFVGFIQAFVFAMLTLIFFSTAVVGHDEHH